MPKFPLTFNSFEGGWSSDIKQGPAGSFWYSRHMDFRKAPSQISVLPATVKESGTVVTDLVTEMIQLPSGKYVAIDLSGGVYVRDTGGTWTKNATLLPDTAYGMVYNLQQDTIFVPGQTAIHSITGADARFGGTFTVNANVFKAQVDQSSSNGHAQTYTTTGSIAEDGLNSLVFTPTIEPLYSVKLFINTPGTGSVTVTLHDAANNALATAVVAASGLVAGSYVEFVFSPAARMLAKPNPAKYHLHVTHSGGTASTIGTSTASDFSTVDYKTLSNRLMQPNNGFHPCIEFLQYILIGNGRYVAVWEPIALTNPSALEFLQHRLTFPEGYEATSMCLFNEFVAIACEKRSTNATSQYQEGKIFLWDGTATTYNTIIDVPEGAPYALKSSKNVMYYFAGGSWWASTGGTGVKLFQMPNTDTEFSNANTYMVNYPNTIAVRNGILLGAFPSETNSAAIEHAVYSFGQRNKNYPPSFGYSYDMSTGSRTNGILRQGMLKSFGDKLFLSWRDGTNYGVDKVDPNSPPFAMGTWESLLSDVEIISIRRRFPRPDKRKQATYLAIVFKPLPTGCTVTPKFKIDREANWESSSSSVGGVGDTIVTLPINKSYKESQVGFDITATTTTPEILLVVLVIDSLPGEGD